MIRVRVDYINFHFIFDSAFSQLKHDICFVVSQNAFAHIPSACVCVNFSPPFPAAKSISFRRGPRELHFRASLCLELQIS